MPNSKKNKKTDLSVVIPLYNEEESVEKLYNSVTASLRATNKTYEILFIDDGSHDATFEKSKNIAKNDKKLRIIKFRKNAGQTPAMVAGINHAKGDIIITMDGDLQNDPSDIPRYLQKVKEGYDIVCGIRQKRQDKLITRKIPSKIANWMIGKITGVPIKDNGCSLRAYKSAVVKNVPLYSEMHRFIPAMMSMTKANIAEIPVAHHAREFGVSKYGLNRIYKVVLDLIVVKSIITYIRHPIFVFFIGTFASFCLSIIPLFGFIILNSLKFSSSLIIAVALSQVFGVLSLSLLFYGILADFIYKTGDYKIENLSKILSNKY